MQLGAVTYNVLKDMDLETIIGTLEKAGFEGVELRTDAQARRRAVALRRGARKGEERVSSAARCGC